MIMRVITLFRGILASLEVDVSSSLLWRDLAEDVLAVRSSAVLPGPNVHLIPLQPSSERSLCRVSHFRGLRSQLDFCGWAREGARRSPSNPKAPGSGWGASCGLGPGTPKGPS